MVFQTVLCHLCGSLLDSYILHCRGPREGIFNDKELVIHGYIRTGFSLSVVEILPGMTSFCACLS